MQKTTNDQGNQNSGSLSNQKTATKNQNNRKQRKPTPAQCILK